MGFLRDQASRLIRTKWQGDTDLFAEELYAIFTGDEPITFDSPVTIQNTTNDSPLTIRDFGSSDQTIQITKRPVAQPNQPDIPPLDLSGLGGVTITNVYPDGSVEYFKGDGGAPPPPAKKGTGTNPNTGSGGGGGLPGQVVSGGPGSDYLVAVYDRGLGSPPVNRGVRQLSIAADATIPAGTWVTVHSVAEAAGGGTTLFMQVPVWLEDLS